MTGDPEGGRTEGILPPRVHARGGPGDVDLDAGAATVARRYGPLVGVPHLGTTVRAWRDRPRTLSAVVRDAAARWPDAPAVEHRGRTWSYAAWDRAVDVVAGVLHAAGVRHGDRVGVALGHSPELAAAPFAASRLGAAALLLNGSLSPVRWAAQLDVVGARLVVADATTQAAAHAAAAERAVVAAPVLDPTSGVAGGTELPAPPPASAVDDAAEDDPVALVATSGTTGVPKVAIVTTRGLVHAALAYAVLLRLGEGEERSFVVLPLHYIGPLSAQTTAMALLGGACVLPDDVGARGALDRMADARATHLDAVPAWLSLLAREPRRSVPTWRTLIYGGAPMPHETAARLAAAHPDLELWDVWGLSETHGPATAHRYDPRTPPLPGIVGRPLEGLDVRTDGDPADGTATGGVGELLVRGANVTTGYLDDAAGTAAVLRGGWLRTGDVGAVGRDGTVRLLDRAKDVILRGGANVFSVEVEQVLARHPDVREAAVYGMPEPVGGEAVHAAVVLEPGAVLDVLALRRLVAAEVGNHAAPRRVRAVDVLPRNPTGKIDKVQLRAEEAP